jgi:hypothetical protein
MALGHLSILGEKIGVKRPFDNPYRFTDKAEEWAETHREMCLAYGRDRGDADTDADVVPSTEFEEWFEEFNYLFIYNRWLIRSKDNTNNRWVQVTDLLKES